MSWATQQDAADNPVDYDADYFLIEAAVKVTDLATFGVGFEVLESDNSMSPEYCPTRRPQQGINQSEPGRRLRQS